MAETLDLDKLEELLETMEPAEIRTRYADALAAHPACNHMLTTFEDMDDDLLALKASVGPAPTARKQEAAHTIPLGAPSAPSPKTPRYWRLQFALPLAAVVVFALVFLLRLPGPEENMTAMSADTMEMTPMEEPLIEADDLVVAESAESDGMAEEETRLDDTLKEQDAAKAPAPEPQRKAPPKKASLYEKKKSYLKKDSIDRARQIPQKVLDQKNYEPEPVKEEDFAEEDSGLDRQEMLVSNPKLADEVRTKKQVKKARPSALPETDKLRESLADDPQGSANLGGASRGASQASVSPSTVVSSDMDASLSPVISWLDRYHILYSSPNTRRDTSLFTKGATVQLPTSQKAPWPELSWRGEQSKDGYLLHGTFGEKKRTVRYNLVLDAEGLCTSLTRSK